MGTHVIEKIYDEGRAAMRTQSAVERPYDEDGFPNIVGEMLEKYDNEFLHGRPTPDLVAETKCWAATVKIVDHQHVLDEVNGKPSPPLYIETLNNVDLFKVKQPSSAGSIRLKPRFTKMNKADMLHWLEEKAGNLKLKAALAPESDARTRELCVDLADEIEASDISFTRKHLLDLCERVWNAL